MPGSGLLSNPGRGRPVREISGSGCNERPAACVWLVGGVEHADPVDSPRMLGGVRRGSIGPHCLRFGAGSWVELNVDFPADCFAGGVVESGHAVGPAVADVELDSRFRRRCGVVGRLELDGQGCIVIEGSHLIWPAGFTAGRGGDETAILDANGAVVAKVGWNVFLGGGVGIGAPIGPCGPGDSFWIQSDVGVPIPLYDQDPLEPPGPQTVTGALVAEADGCVRLRTGTRVIDLVWPRFTAGTHVADGITVSKDGNSVRTGQQVQFMGSSGGKNAAVAGTCVADPATAFVINSPAETWSTS